VNSVTYFTGGEEEPGRPEKIKLDLPGDIRVQRIGENQTLSAMLAGGEIDALYTARTPSSYATGGAASGACSRTTPTWRRSTSAAPGCVSHHAHGGDPREVYEEYPWVAQSL